MSISPWLGQSLPTVQLDVISTRSLTKSSRLILQGRPRSTRVLWQVGESGDEETLVVVLVGLDSNTATTECLIAGQCRLGINTQVHLATLGGDETLLLGLGSAQVVDKPSVGVDGLREVGSIAL